MSMLIALTPPDSRPAYPIGRIELFDLLDLYPYTVTRWDDGSWRRIKLEAGDGTYTVALPKGWLRDTDLA